jgi:hypothetical protein
MDQQSKIRMTKLRTAGIGIDIKEWRAGGFYNADSSDRGFALSAAKDPDLQCRSHSAVPPLADRSYDSDILVAKCIADRASSNRPMCRNLLFKKL